VAANSKGEERGPVKPRGITPARAAVIAALALVVIVLAFVIFGSGGGHSYNLLFQNASQLVPDNQVEIGGQPVGSVESIGLTDDNLAEVKINVEQELHEGTTAVIRATSLSGVANHYVSTKARPSGSRRRPPRPTSTSSSTRFPSPRAKVSPTSSRAAPPATSALGPTPTRPTNSSPRG
jgi:ABC-type transporter Mla subunit MlaD